MRLVRRVVMVLLSLFCCLGLSTGHASNGGIYTDLYDFDGTNGDFPQSALTLSGGVFYGTAAGGGTSDNGVIFSFDPSSSTYTDLVNFTGIAGAFPGSGPVAALTLNDGVFYGTTAAGGTSNRGVIFSFDPSTSTYTVVHNFDGTRGAGSRSALTLSGGIFYGTTFSGGASGDGVIFSFDPSSSTYTDLHDFDDTHGANSFATLILNDGIFYGTTLLGGASSKGVIFSFDPSTSTYTDLHDFDGTHGSNPRAGLTLNGKIFYGTATSGGASNFGVIFSFDPSSSTYTDLVNFTGNTGAFPGSNPAAPLTLSGGVFCGTTFDGGAGGNGVIFSFDPSSSTYIDLYDFDGTHGSLPEAALTLSGGIFYGTATNGGASDLGVIFSFAPLLPPSNLTGHQKKNNSGARYEWFNGLKWQTPTLSGTEVAGYNIYRDGVKIATLSPSTLHYNDHNRKKGVKTLYSVTTINVQGNESSRVNITVP